MNGIACISTRCLPGLNKCYCIDISHFTIHPSFGGHLGWCNPLAITNNGGKNICVHNFEDLFSILLELKFRGHMIIQY